MPGELQPSFYYPRLVASALSVVSADANAFLREAGAQAHGWVEHWIGCSHVCGGAEYAHSSVSPAHDSEGGAQDAGGAEGLRRKTSAAACEVVGQLLGKLCVSGKARAVAVALLALATEGRSTCDAGGGMATGGSWEGDKVRGAGESVVSFLAAAAAEEKTAVVCAVERVGGAVGCVLGREVLRCVPTYAWESLLAALINVDEVLWHESAGSTAARGQSNVGRVRIGGGVRVVGGGVVRAELVALVSQIVKDRWDVLEVLHSRFLTERTLSERVRARLFSLLLAVDVLESKTDAGRGQEEEAEWGDARGQERGMRVAARRLAQVFADEQFAKCGGDAQQDHVCGLLVRCLLHLGVYFVHVSNVCKLDGSFESVHARVCVCGGLFCRSASSLLGSRIRVSIYVCMHT